MLPLRVAGARPNHADFLPPAQLVPCSAYRENARTCHSCVGCTVWYEASGCPASGTTASSLHFQTLFRYHSAARMESRRDSSSAVRTLQLPFLPLCFLAVWPPPT